LGYTTGTNEITYFAKTFVIPNPSDNNKYLVHACLEGPEAGVYYRGKGEIVDNISTTIELPDYVEQFSTDFTIQITQIADKNNVQQIHHSATEIENNKFTVFGQNGKFYWLVHGKRHDITTEPDKYTVNVKGDGPYKWI
jgi:hypothetical protein